MGFVNIIATDWRRLALAEGPFAPLAYYSVMSNGVPITGTRICKMIRFLMKTNIITGPEQVNSAFMVSCIVCKIIPTTFGILGTPCWT